MYLWDGEEYNYSGTATKVEGHLLHLKDVYDPLTDTAKKLVVVNTKAPNFVRIETV